jgi:hypothetical protein
VNARFEVITVMLTNIEILDGSPCRLVDIHQLLERDVHVGLPFMWQLGAVKRG